MYTEKVIRDKPAVLKIFTGLPAPIFWQLVEQLGQQEAEYNRQRFERPNRERSVGGGRKADLPLAIRLALVLTYLRLHIPQEAVAALYAGATQSDVSRQLRILLPALSGLLPCPAVWDKIDESHPLRQEDLLEFVQLSDGRVIIDATEQQIYRSEVNEIRKQSYSGKKNNLRSKLRSLPMERIILLLSRLAFPVRSAIKSFVTKLPRWNACRMTLTPRQTKAIKALLKRCLPKPC
jgi:hypothetical protein